MTESQRQSWERERAQGRDRFILRGLWRRCIWFGVISSVVVLALELMSGRIPSLSLGVWNCLVMILVVTLGGGWSEGARIWYKREKEYESESRHNVV